ncbi:SET and MYND domain-containing protein 3 [Trichonephila clavata]|uniref:SET and MYND domain-containing protein 3 n=1 Tax=Trichonephila clavata TaxID=2740835 RepID=A0A8X6HII4_TRICU|nr:SET and MYND domain-containing protein 3 [Trichonephila clavata]
MAASHESFYELGDVIYEGKPFMRAIRKDLWGEICTNCLRRTSDLKFCKGCGIMKYCSKTCQKADWCYHKFECSLLKRCSDDQHLSTSVLIGNVIMKMQKANWKPSSEKILNETVTFDNLRTLRRERSINSIFGIALESIKNSLNVYIGEKNIPDDKLLRSLIGKVLCNQVVYGHDQAVSAMFIGLSRFNISCIPNCDASVSNHILSVRCMKKIKKNGGKFSINISPLITSFNLNLECSEVEIMCNNRDPCSYCQMPYGTSPLTEVLDMANAGSVIMESEDTLQLANYLLRLDYPLGVISQLKLRQLLQKQKGILGNTNILRIRTLVLKCLMLNGPIMEMREDLLELADLVKTVWGPNFRELLPIYAKLMDTNLRLGEPFVASVFERECNRLREFFLPIDESHGLFNAVFAQMFGYHR